MAIVNFNRKDLESLIGEKIGEKKYREVLPMLGTPLESISEEEVSFEIFPNRPDLLSVEGFARAVQGFLGLKSGLQKYNVRKSNYQVKIDRSLQGIRGCAAFAVIKNIKFTDEFVAEFMQLQEKLAVTIGRRRKKCSIGTYDLREITFPVRLTTKPGNFKFRPLGFAEELTIKEILEKHPKGQEYGHLLKGWNRYPVYVDAKNNVLSLLPITNAEFSKIRPDTKEMLIEVTGTDWKPVFEMLNIVVTAFADRGCEIYEVRTGYDGKTVTAPNLKPWKIKIDTGYVNKLLDLDLKQNDIKKLLEKMRFGVSGNSVYVPPYRTDIMHPIDLVEDIAIAHGYEKFEPRIPRIATIAKPNPNEELENEIREIMIGLGFQEVINFILTNQRKQFDFAKRKKSSFVKIKNPKTEDYTMARDSIFPEILEVFSQNASSEMPQKIFEVGITLQVDKNAETGALNKRKLSAGILHNSANYSEMKSYLDAFFRSLGISFKIKESREQAFIEGRAVDIFVNGKKIGILGEVSPEVLNNFEIEYPAVLFEIDIDFLAKPK